MSADVEGEATHCATCGREWREADNDREQWLSVEISRIDSQGEEHWLYENFCSQDHAAEWLSRPLPPPESQPPYTFPPETLKERITNGSSFSAFCGRWA